MKKKVHNPVESSYFSSLTSNDSVNRNISSIFSQLPHDIHDLAYNLSLEEKEALAYVIKWNDQENQKCSTSKPHATSFKCDCCKCKSIFMEIWFSSENHDDMNLFFKCAMEHKNSNKKGKNKKKVKNYQEQSLQEIHQREHGSCSNGVKDLTPLIGELGLQSAGSDVIQKTPLETTEVALSEGGRRGSHKSYSRILFPDVLGVCNSRLWRLWYPIVREEEEETAMKY
ncbi:hypothetical protein LIER_15175 [Lithospermum erythrorhizon]|uniref:Uncharacterized protein n=1 Tax=Lithospermum erythrorhizon TaxID=34254 RepID=A0AAV3Q459_LITER